MDEGERSEGSDERIAREEERRRQDAEARELLQRIAAGKLTTHAGSSLLFRAFRMDILKYFKVQGLSIADAEDQTQIVLVKIWENAGAFRGDALVRTWIISIARNALTDFWRARKRSRMQQEDPELMPDIADDSPSVAAVLDRQSWEDCYRREFTRFAHDHPERAEAIRGQVLDQLSTSEVARLLGRSPGATREFLSQSKAKLEQYLSRCNQYREALRDV